MAMEGEDLALQQHRVQANQVINQQGGFVFEVNDVAKLSRLLIVSQSRVNANERIRRQELIRESLHNLIRNGRSDEVIEMLKDFSAQGRCCQRSNVIYCLALCARYSEGEHSKSTRRAAYRIFPQICLIPTDLFQFAQYYKTISKIQDPRFNTGSGWGRAHKRAIRNWYLKKEGKKLAYFATKYKRRNGWSHKDLLKLCHPKPSKDMKCHLAVFKYISHGYQVMERCFNTNPQPLDLCETLGILFAVHEASRAENKEDIIDLIRNHGLVHEQVPNRFLKDREVWAELLRSGVPMMALIRNLGKLTEMELFKNEDDQPANELLEKVCNSLTNEEYLCNARIHPLFILRALKVYREGWKLKGSYMEDKIRDWTPNQRILDALDDAFYKTLKCPTSPIRKRCFIAIDVSKSMFGERETVVMNINGVLGCSQLYPAEVAAAMTMSVLQDNNDDDSKPVVMGFSDNMEELDIRRGMRLNDVLHIIRQCPSGRTDCALPMIFAMDNHIIVDNFIIFTDNATYYGDVHPFEALKNYRAVMRSERKTAEPVKLIVCAMTSTEFTIANPDDPAMLDIPGFDLNTPQIIGDFTSLKFCHQ